MRPLCFVVMPFGTKRDPSGGPDIDFDAVYREAIGPAVEAAGLEPLRADHELAGGVIHKAMYERLVLADYAVADLTTANANVFYELGVRHAVRPATTVTIYASHQAIPFDVNLLRSLPYDLGDANAFGPAEAAALREALGGRLAALVAEAGRGPLPDSPLFDLLDGYQGPDLVRLKTDTFRDRVAYAQGLKDELAALRRAGDRAGLEALRARLAADPAAEAGVHVDLMLSFRALSDWDGMVRAVEGMPAPLRRTVLVREQLGFALNRRGDRDRALQVLEAVWEEHGPSSETGGLLGRIHKDRWEEAREAGRDREARGHLRRAIEAYARGFEADWRDAYPGINAATLLDVQGDPESLARRDALVPVVRFAVAQRLRGGTPDYWDHATLLELAVLGGDEAAAERHLDDALAAVREPWEPETTAKNLRIIAGARAARDAGEPWLDEAVAALDEAAAAAR